MLVIPFILGTIGYRSAGKTLSDSLYGALQLYSMSLFSDTVNIWLEIARWTAPLATATAILYAFTKSFRYLKWYFEILLFRKDDSVAVYTDTNLKINFEKKDTREIYSGIVRKSAKSHIILMHDDKAGFGFYEENKEALKNKKVYIGIHDVKLGLLKENPDVIYFDINGTIARLLWKKIGIWKRKDHNIRIVIWRKSSLAENILSYGLLLNLYDLSQHIKYYVVDDVRFQRKHPDLQLMNKDAIIYLRSDQEKTYDMLREADLVLLADETDTETFQTIATSVKDTEFYYYSKYEGDIGDIISSGNKIPFGRDKDVYTDQNIRQEELTKKAKQLNMDYLKIDGEQRDEEERDKEWEKLSGFLKWSNISEADFTDVIKDLSKKGETDIEKLAELEHIRWCRFHFLNYWKYGIPDHESRDQEKRIHACLKPYRELTEFEKDKDREFVRGVLKET